MICQRNIIVMLVLLSCFVSFAQAYIFNLNLIQGDISTGFKVRSSSVPNDPFLFPNDELIYHQYHLNIQANGFSIDYPATWQFAKGHAMVGMIDDSIYGNHPDLLGNFKHHLSSPYIVIDELHPVEGIFYDHGSWVLSVLAPTNNNNEGLTGVCLDCSIIAEGGFLQTQGFDAMIKNGVQVINLSFGGSPELYPDHSCEGTPEFCDLVENTIAERDILLVSISQNRYGVNSAIGNGASPLLQETFPGSHPNVIQVGGVDESLQFWNNCDGFEGPSTCGSFASKSQELVAPAKNILIAITYGEDGLGSCGYINSFHPFYDICSGNSFAAPQVAGLIGIMRSIYPQLSADNVRLILQKTAQSPYEERHDEWGYGLIDPLSAVTEVIGSVAGVQQTNRSIPVFTVRSQQSMDTISSSSPQIIAAALASDLRNYGHNYDVLEIGLPLNEYRIPAASTLPYGTFYLLGTHNNPLHPGEELIKLYRLSKATDLTLEHAFVTDLYIEDFESQGYEVDAIEGYIYPPCDDADNTCQAPLHTECLIARNMAGETTDWAIMLSSQINQSEYVNHTVKLIDDEDPCLGYAYQPLDTDSDGLIDGYEAFIGTDINQVDSDNDGRSDGEEMLKPIEGAFSDPLDSVVPFQVNAGLTGAWYNPETSGQGLMFDVIEETGYMFVAWFNYGLDDVINEVEFGHSNHRWFTAQGAFEDNQADLTLYTSDGGIFDDPKSVVTTNIGSLKVIFTSCTTGVVTYRFNQSQIQGSFPIERIGPDKFCNLSAAIEKSIATVELNPIISNEAGLSGTWHNPATSGQGILLDVIADPGLVFATWFTYSPDENINSSDFGSSNHRWFTAQGKWIENGTEMDLFLTQGGVFDQLPSTSTESIGELKIIFNNCRTATVSYQFSALNLSGQFPIERISPNVYCQDN